MSEFLIRVFYRREIYTTVQREFFNVLRNGSEQYMFFFALLLSVITIIGKTRNQDTETVWYLIINGFGKLLSMVCQ